MCIVLGNGQSHNTGNGQKAKMWIKFSKSECECVHECRTKSIVQNNFIMMTQSANTRQAIQDCCCCFQFLPATHTHYCWHSQYCPFDLAQVPKLNAFYFVLGLCSTILWVDTTQLFTIVFFFFLQKEVWMEVVRIKVIIISTYIHQEHLPLYSFTCTANGHVRTVAGQIRLATNLFRFEPTTERLLLCFFTRTCHRWISI